MSAPTTSQKRPFPYDNSNDDHDPSEPTFFISSPIVDRSSTFVAHFHPHRLSHRVSTTTTPSTASTSLTSTVKSAQSHPSFRTADHRIVAWRRPSGQRTLTLPSTSQPVSSKPIYATGSDDDGEKYAGKRLERVLADLDVEGIVVVARWYGGIMLGPVRFTHIENVAKEAIGKWRAWERERERAWGGNGIGIAEKRMRIDGNQGGQQSQSFEKEQADRSRLAKQLVERDHSIVVLRGLLAEKQGNKKIKTYEKTGDTKIEADGDGGASASASADTNINSSPLDSHTNITKPTALGTSPSPSPSSSLNAKPNSTENPTPNPADPDTITTRNHDPSSSTVQDRDPEQVQVQVQVSNSDHPVSATTTTTGTTVATTTTTTTSPPPPTTLTITTDTASPSGVNDSSTGIDTGSTTTPSPSRQSQSQPQPQPQPTSESHAQTTNNATSPNPTNTTTTIEHYLSLPLPRLRQLEKARDATIAFILKQLDKLDQEEEREQGQK
ncbi:hypothetical protein ABEF95_011944 [Exophiala dermatitidis]